jgi:hypothetical protein
VGQGWRFAVELDFPALELPFCQLVEFAPIETAKLWAEEVHQEASRSQAQIIPLRLIIGQVFSAGSGALEEGEAA